MIFDGHCFHRIGHSMMKLQETKAMKLTEGGEADAAYEAAEVVLPSLSK